MQILKKLPARSFVGTTAYKSPSQYRISRCVDQETHKQQKVLQVDAQQAAAH